MKIPSVLAVLSILLLPLLYVQTHAQNELQKKVIQVIEDTKSAGTEDEPVSQATKDFIDSAINSQLNSTIENKQESMAAILGSSNCKDWVDIKTQKTPVISDIYYYKKDNEFFAVDPKRQQSISYQNGKFLSLKIMDKAVVGFYDKSPVYRGINNEKIHIDLAGMLQAMALVAADSVTDWNVSFRKGTPVILKNIQDKKDDLLKDYGFLGCVKEVCFVTKDSKSLILTSTSKVFPKLKSLGVFSSARLQKFYNMCNIIEKNTFLTDSEVAMRNFSSACGITVDPNYYNDLSKTVIAGCNDLRKDLLPRVQNFKGSSDY